MYSKTFLSNQNGSFVFIFSQNTFFSNKLTTIQLYNFHASKCCRSCISVQIHVTDLNNNNKNPQRLTLSHAVVDAGICNWDFKKQKKKEKEPTTNELNIESGKTVISQT